MCCSSPQAMIRLVPEQTVLSGRMQLVLSLRPPGIRKNAWSLADSDDQIMELLPVLWNRWCLREELCLTDHPKTQRGFPKTQSSPVELGLKTSMIHSISEGIVILFSGTEDDQKPTMNPWKRKEENTTH
ncbi:uncharacterized protein LOC144302944 [Canis aureus]